MFFLINVKITYLSLFVMSVNTVFVLICYHYMFVYIVKSVCNNKLFLYFLLYGHGLFIFFFF